MTDGNESDIVPSRIVAKMGRLDGSDMGKGRRKPMGEESSSSRDSSPRQRHRRSFSPNSDDGVVIPPIEDDDTPPPAAPILRKPVAFSKDTFTSAPHIDTYEAPAPSRLAATAATYFLPGQEVPSSTPPQPRPPPRGSQAPKKKKAKTRHYNDGFSDKTGSFRLKAFVNNPKAAHLDVRPYSQLNRGPVISEPQQAMASGSQSTLSASSQTSGSAGFRIPGGAGTAMATAASSAGTSQAGPSQPGPSASAYPVPALAVNAFSTLSAFPTATSSGNVQSISFNVITPAQHSSTPASVAGPSAARPSRSDPAPLPQTTPQRPNPLPNTGRISDQRPPQRIAPNTTTTQSHYRRDYERDKFLTSLPQATSTSANAQTSQSANTSGDAPRTKKSRNRASAAQAQNSDSRTQEDAGDQSPTAAQVEKPKRLITLLIEDLRSGETDLQLAEVRVHLRPAPLAEDGFWANAMEVAQELQSSPSRIDGPAKVYTLRSKYRQIFLRVTAENEDITTSANLIVNKDRTLQVIVEALLPANGSLPPPPIALERLVGIPGHDGQSLSSSPSSTAQLRGRTGDRKKRKRSTSYSSGRDSDTDGSTRRHRDKRRHRRSRPRQHKSSSPESSSSPNAQKQSSDRQRAPKLSPEEMRERIKSRLAFFPDALRKKNGELPMWAQFPPSREPTPESDADPETIDEAIVKSIQPTITEDEHWREFMRLKAIPPPLTVPDTLKQYRFVQKKVNEWQGRLAPFKSARLAVKKIHVLKALFVDERWGSECTETLDLIELYGPDGEHYEDPRVSDMLEDSSEPKGRPAKRLLRLLREVHQNWSNERQQAESVEPPGPGKGKGREAAAG